MDASVPIGLHDPHPNQARQAYLNPSELDVVERKPDRPVTDEPQEGIYSKQMVRRPRRVNSERNALSHRLEEASSEWYHVEAQSQPAAAKKDRHLVENALSQKYFTANVTI